MTLQGNGAALSSAALRRAFSEFFEARGHLQASLPGIVLREGRVLHAA